MSESKFVIVLKGDKIEKISSVEFARKFAEYAILASNVYPSNKTAKYFIPTHPSWRKFDETLLPKIPLPTLRTQKMIHGLFYEVWTRQIENKIEAVIVFKGTTINIVSDWICNLRWLTQNPFLKHIFRFFFWDYYHQVQSLTPKLIECIKKNFPTQYIDFVSTGHSLGGGLAQQAAYTTNDIKKVFAFNSSPVTGYKDIKKQDRLHNEMGIEISRIYQYGEILFFFRKVAKHFHPLTTINPEIKEYQFSFFEGSAFDKHDMHQLAMNLLKASEE